MNVSRQTILEYGKPLRDLDLAAPEALWERVGLLKQSDRLLVELALRGGASHRRIAQLVGGTPGGVSRRLKRLSRRLYDPLVLALLHPHCPLDGPVRQIGVQRWLIGHSAQALAAEHELSVARVRQILSFIDLWYRGVVAARRSAGFANASPTVRSSASTSAPPPAPGGSQPKRAGEAKELAKSGALTLFGAPSRASDSPDSSSPISSRPISARPVSARPVSACPAPAPHVPSSASSSPSELPSASPHSFAAASPPAETSRGTSAGRRSHATDRAPAAPLASR